jgi:catechol 2,3-dioxygenase-like lactoylglutathione lyase family enzyme
MAVSRVDHVSFTVSDLGRAVTFWEALLGYGPSSHVEYGDEQDAEVVGYPDVRMSAAYFDLPGGTLLELFQYANPASAAPPSNETYVVGNAHLGLVLDDLDLTCERVRAQGATLRSAAPVPLRGGAHAGGRSIYIRDPDGITIELLELPPRR